MKSTTAGPPDAGAAAPRETPDGAPERRRGEGERRRRAHMPRRPFHDSNGDLIALDRRFLPDRRAARVTAPAGGKTSPS